MKKQIIILSLIFIVIISGCINNESDATGNLASQKTGDIEKLEIIHFHGTHQCYSCIMVGDLAEETVNTYFKDELRTGKISFQHINGELSENYELVRKYGVTSASLWVGAYYKDGNFVPEQDTNVWYKINDKEEYMNYLKSIIEQKI